MSFGKWFVSGLQFLAGGILLLVPGGEPFGVPLLIGGAVSAAAIALAPRPAGGPEGFKSSPTYGFDQVTNAAFEGAPVPIVLGRNRYAPPLVSLYTAVDGANQKLYLLYLLSAGGRYGVSNLRNAWINGEPHTTFNAKVSWWPGTDPQGSGKNLAASGALASALLKAFGIGPTSPKQFDKTGTPHDANVRLDSVGATFTYTTKTAVDEIAIVVAWYGGIYKTELSGSNAGETVETMWGGWLYYKDAGSTTTTYARTSGWAEGWTANTGNYWQLSAKTNARFYRIMRIRFPSKAIRTIHVKANAADKTQGSFAQYVRTATIQRVEEIVYSDKDYDGYAVMAIEAVASEQLSGGLPTVEVELDGWLSQPVAGGAASFSRNPVRNLRELMLATPSQGGLGDWITSSDIHTSSWSTVSTACDTLAFKKWVKSTNGQMIYIGSGDAQWQLDIVLDSLSAAPEWIDHILSTFRASLIEVRGQLRLFLDAAASTDRTFDARQSPGAGNRPILELDDGRADIRIAEIDKSQLATHTQVTYFDAADRYRRATTPEFISVDWSSGDPIVRQEPFFPGITRNTQALREAQYHMERARLRTKVIEFGIGLGDFDLLPGAVVALYADSPALSGDLFQVISVSYASTLEGRVSALQYDADVYDDDYNVARTPSQFLTREEALARTSRIPKGIVDLSVTVLP